MAKSFTLPADADTRPATPKQRAFLARLEHKTNFGEEMTMAECAVRIASAKHEAVAPAATPVVEDFQALYSRAQAAGRAAVGNTDVNWGACGFAWVIIKPGTSRFARWLKEKKLARPDSYYGGVTIWVSDYNQSVHCKSLHAVAMAKVFQDAGINAYAMDRLD
jgi:hypothetical protein